jgi:hypothetical protein
VHIRKTQPKTCLLTFGDKRPTSWCRKSTASPARLTSTIKKSQPLAELSELAAATRKPLRLNKFPPTCGSNEKVNKDVKNAPVVSAHTETIYSSEFSPKPRENHMGKLSFAPSFVPKSKIVSIATVDAVVEDLRGEGGHLVRIPDRTSMSGSAPNFFASPQPVMKRRRMNKVTGKWVQRLVALRNCRNTDVLRLQNQAFARHSGMNLNNPRKRAKAMMDVTIVGQYNGPWVNLPEDFPITVLGYLHRHVQLLKNSHSSAAPMEKERTAQKDVFAWFTFRLSTARMMSLERGCRMKIYNAVVLPSPTAVELAIPSSIPHLRDGISHYCRTIVICTDLCERSDSM